MFPDSSPDALTDQQAALNENEMEKTPWDVSPEELGARQFPGLLCFPSRDVDESERICDFRPGSADGMLILLFPDCSTTDFPRRRSLSPLFRLLLLFSSHARIGRNLKFNPHRSRKSSGVTEVGIVRWFVGGSITRTILKLPDISHR